MGLGEAKGQEAQWMMPLVRVAQSLPMAGSPLSPRGQGGSVGSFGKQAVPE